MADRGTLLAERLAATRQRTLDLYAPLAHEHLVGQPAAFLSPPLWDLGHIGAYEELWLARRVGGHPALHPELDDVYDAFETPRARRGDVEILDEAAAHRYLATVRERALEALEASDLDDPGRPLLAGGFVFEMVAEHEAQHTETVLQALQVLPAGAYRPPARRADPGGRALRRSRVVRAARRALRHGRAGRGLRLRLRAAAAHPRAGGLRDRPRPGQRGGVARLHAPTAATGAPSCGARRAGRGAPRRTRRRRSTGERDGEGGWLVRYFDEIAPVAPDRPCAT